MSDSIPKPNQTRDWHLYLDDMIKFAEKAMAYTDGLDRQQFEASGMTYDATVRNIELIGEAATNIPDSVRACVPSIQWRQIISMRNHLIHGYLGIDSDTLWSVIQEDIPQLKEALLALKKVVENNQLS